MLSICQSAGQAGVFIVKYHLGQKIYGEKIIMILSCNHISKSFGDNQILSNISFYINDHEKCGIVGINGVGKTTLLKILVGEEPADSGEVIIPKDVTIGYLRQREILSSDNTIYEEIQSAKKDVYELEKKIRRLEHDMKEASSDKLDSMYKEYNRCVTEFERIGGYACESEINGIIKGLGFVCDAHTQKTDTLSGGEKTRVALGKLLISSPDLIILDEPTNHLDMNSIAWLENYLLNYKGAVLIVAHDRYFLDKIITKTIELDNGNGMVFSGNYSAYAEKKAKLREDMMKAYYKQQKEIAHQEEVIKKLKSFNREKSIKRAESREKALNKIKRINKPFTIDNEIKIKFTPVIESGNDVLAAEGLAKAFGDNRLFSNIGFDIKKGERVAIIGDNGCGKTTLLKIINDVIPADSGTIRLGTNVYIGYYDQEHEQLEPDNTLYEEISDEYPDMTTTEIRNLLAAFLFTGDDVFKLVKEISGGERSRLALAKLMLSDANFLILDEPTNHLDILSKELLEDALKNYTGTVLYVSHDRYFINQTATRILNITSGRADNYIGNYDYYLEKKDAVTAAATKMTAQTTTNSPVSTNSDNKNDWEKQKELKAAKKRIETKLQKCEKDIEATEEKLAEVNDALSDPANGYNSLLLNDLTKEQEALIQKLDELMALWEELSYKAENIES